MRRSFASLLIACTASLALPSHAAQTIPVRLAPEGNAPVVGQIAADHPGLREAPPVPARAKAEAGWRQARIKATWGGYVAESALSKNFQLRTGAIVRSSPAADAPILTRVEADDRFEVRQKNGDYRAVRFTKPVAVYFRSDAAGERDSTITAIDPLSRTRADTAAAPAPERAERGPGQAADLQPIDVMVPPVQTQARERPLRPQAEADTPTRRLSGTLVRKISNFGPNYPLRLESEKGRRIAYVDLNRVFISNLQPYLDRKVIIQGDIRPISAGGRDIVIHAHNLRKLD